jgi:site-specific recombinase XerC
MIRDLHALGFTLVEVKNLKPRHVQALASHWEFQGLSASSLQKRFSYLRLLCSWIGKPGMVGDADEYLRDPR